MSAKAERLHLRVDAEQKALLEAECGRIRCVEFRSGRAGRHWRLVGDSCLRMVYVVAK
ncbi:hypothetical protein [Micromonospora violae]|uniref:hypothetical protein n=1 Tax=Micromonospora violae TaxID=1278207 RepID=UPI0013EF5614|nr:hypothetical protein [Micromonospora violae]